MRLEPKILELLAQRGITSEEDLEEFLSSRPQKTHDPFLLYNMREGVDLVMDAIRSGDKICIYGDYDVDGITSTVIMIEVLSHLTDRDRLMYYIPSRFEEGYGLHCSSIDRIREAGANTIITVDCGSVSVKEVDYIKSLGMKVLVTDHHTVGDQVADCLVINPKQPQDTYPCEHIAGCGVAFKLAQALVAENGLPTSVTAGLLDMLAIGTVADLVPLVGENRTFVKYGLRTVNVGRRESLLQLINAISLHPGKITAENISFGIGPHINAVGRMQHAREAVELFLTHDPAVRQEKIQLLIRCNDQRKQVQEDIFQRCMRMAEDEYSEDHFLLLVPENGHEGVAGNVAGKLKEALYKPVVVFTREGGGIIKGSGRSIDGINIYDELAKNKALFQAFGGHAAACGITMREEDLPALRQALRRQMETLLEKDPEIFVEKKRADLSLRPQDISMNMAQQLELLEPCGMGNEKPLTMVTGHARWPRRIGKNGQFLRFQIALENGNSLPAVAFRNADEIEEFADGEACHFLGNLSVNVWNGRSSLQFVAEEAIG